MNSTDVTITQSQWDVFNQFFDSVNKFQQGMSDWSHTVNGFMYNFQTAMTEMLVIGVVVGLLLGFMVAFMVGRR